MLSRISAPTAKSSRTWPIRSGGFSIAIRNVTDNPLCEDKVHNNWWEEMSYRCMKPVEVPTISRDEVSEIVRLVTGDLSARPN